LALRKANERLRTRSALHIAKHPHALRKLKEPSSKSPPQAHLRTHFSALP
jgi:hypothetical protein